MTQENIRKIILKALVSDDWFFKQLVLKGGNALSLVYKVGNRSSLDLDFSIESDFNDLNPVKQKIKDILYTAFENYDIRLFDYHFEKKPQITSDPWWGGYRVEFKLITEDLADKLNFNIFDMRRQSLVIDPGSQKRKYSIEISKFEFVSEKTKAKIDDVYIFVYTPLLLAVEKLRALLQQHPEYPQISQKAKRSRARDFYDIWVICDYFSIKLDMYLPVVESVFEAKKVDMNLLKKMHDIKDLHQASWADVEVSVSVDLEDFDYYYEFVNEAAQNLYTQWIKNSP